MALRAAQAWPVCAWGRLPLSAMVRKQANTRSCPQFQRVNRALYPEDMAINSDLYRDPVGGAPKLREHGV